MICIMPAGHNALIIHIKINLNIKLRGSRIQASERSGQDISFLAGYMLINISL